MSDDTDSTDNDQSKPWQFKPGRSGNPAGRPKGSRNALSEAFVSALLADWQEHGATAIQRVRLEKPDQYLKVIASILPKDINVRTDPFDDMTDDELATRLREIEAEILATAQARRTH